MGVCKPSHHRRCLTLLMPALAAVATATPLAPAQDAPGTSAGLTRADATIAWQQMVPVPFSAEVRGCYLVDEYLVVVMTDGRASCIRADTGKLLWTRKLASPTETLWPPVAFHGTRIRAIAFTRLQDVLFLDPETGDPARDLPPRRETAEAENEDTDSAELTETEPETVPVGPVLLRDASRAAVAAGPEHVYAGVTDRRIGKYAVADSYRSWEVLVRGPITMAPLYLPDPDLLVAADSIGAVSAARADDRKHVYSTRIEGEPIGWLATDYASVYVATDSPRLYGLDAVTGEITLEYQLADRPRGGPVVTGTSIYQAQARGGVQRIGLELGYKNWLAPGARTFLAEWPQHAVVMQRDGRIAWVRSQDGETEVAVKLGKVTHAVSNPYNDAVMVASNQGDVWCLRPTRAKPLKPEDFRPLAPPPEEEPTAVAAAPSADAAAEPAEGQAGAEPAEQAGAEPAAPVMSIEDQLIANPLQTPVRPPRPAR